jgi:hyperosmotically inducible periplasmic protein
MDYESPMRRLQPLLHLLLMSCLCVGCLSPANTALSDSPRDSVISANVEALLAEDRLGGLSGILVVTKEGTVTLTGTVQRAERKAMAAELARKVKGVKRVKNDLEIRADVSP